MTSDCTPERYLTSAGAPSDAARGDWLEGWPSGTPSASPEPGSARAGSRRTHAPLWHGAAFLVEALVLLAFLAAALAVLFSLFASARTEADRAARLSEAVAIAQNAAEGIAAADDLAADGTHRTQTVTGAQTGTDYELTIALELEPKAAGTLWHATITVRDTTAPDAESALYTLETAHYLPAANGGERHDA